MYATGGRKKREYMKKYKWISIIFIICVISVLLCSCKNKGEDRESISSGNKEQNEINIETKEDDEIDDNQKIESEEKEDSAGVQSDVFNDDKSTNDNKNSSSNTSKDETSTSNNGSSENNSTEDKPVEKPDKEAISMGQDTETGYGAITGSTP